MYGQQEGCNYESPSNPPSPLLVRGEQDKRDRWRYAVKLLVSPFRVVDCRLVSKKLQMASAYQAITASKHIALRKPCVHKKALREAGVGSKRIFVARTSDDENFGLGGEHLIGGGRHAETCELHQLQKGYYFFFFTLRSATFLWLKA